MLLVFVVKSAVSSTTFRTSRLSHTPYSLPPLTLSHPHPNPQTPYDQLENATLQGPKEVLEQKSVDHGFSITTAKGRTYFFHSDRADDTREWLAQLRTAIARAGKSSSAATPASHTPSAAATASGSSKASKPAGAPASSMDDSVGGGLLSFADLSVRNNPQTTSMTLPGSRSSALGVKPRVRSLTADFQRHRQKRPARPKVAQDQDKMAQRVYNLLYKPRYE